MGSNSFTVVAVVIERSVPVKYVCATDTGTILEYPVEGAKGMAALLKWHPEMVRNLTVQQLKPPYAPFPTERNGMVAGTIVCQGTRDSERIFRVVYKCDGVWCTNDFDEEETVSRIKKGLIAKAEVHGKKVTCKAPVRQDLIEASNAVAKPKQLMGKKFDTILWYVTEASDENGHTMRYAGLEFTGSPETIEPMVAGFKEQSILFRDAYYKAFGRKDDALAMQTVPGKLFVVLPYQVAETLLAGGKRAIKLTRVNVSAVAFRGGSVFDEAKVVISGVMGCGEIRGSNGLCDATLRNLIADVQKAIKQHTYARAKNTQATKQD